MEIGKAIGLSYGRPTRDAFGDALQRLGHKNKNIVVVDGDVGNSTRTERFGRRFPDRFFNVGIAESNMIGIASGLAAAGKEPLVASFASFLLGNAYDQVRMGIAFPNLNVKLVGSHAGITVGEDGPSQMGIEDIALATSLPNFTVIVPADAATTTAAVNEMFKHQGPLYLRIGRPPVPTIYRDSVDFEIGKAKWLRDGRDVTLIACGLMVAAALEAAVALSQSGIEARVLDMHTIKPIDKLAILLAAKQTGAIVTAEEHLLQGGLNAAVAQVTARHFPIPVVPVGLADRYAESGSPQALLEKYHLMPHDIFLAAEQAVSLK